MKANQLMLLDPHKKRLYCKGKWTIDNVSTLQELLHELYIPFSDSIVIDGAAITNLDTAGAWFISQIIKKFTARNLKVSLENFSSEQDKLISLVEDKLATPDHIPQIKELNWLASVGKHALVLKDEFLEYLNFIGKLSLESIRIVSTKGHIRFNSVCSVVYSTGCQALPIIAVLSFMIGVVVAYQMGIHLRNYGANLYIVDLLGASIFREFGPLITAIMVAGKTGSAFTAQLGTMKVRQEIDALNTMGVTPTELLLLPKILGLFIAMPLLTIWADIFGIFGGMIMSENMFGITWSDFLVRFQHQVPLRSLIIGLGKAPVFALIIASIGCFEGMQVKGSADSVGKQTTRSVVWAIFFIIVADALFSIIFNKLKL